ncbi:Rha family transcriptional regulator [Rhizobium redzepovicii]|uniref:Rha family transcriptional regulator n=1 Tax=Rhizobium redzepovicii TaxID=2867518 RepID=UPI0028721754|nr:Rha family transcriptional regulator [Rhizobium redzepovicii]MDR9783834.1 Rha family transcriptional regulator [Rhizobium redzepovicii]
MNVLANTAGPLRMSSQEIAYLLEKRHDKVKQSIGRLAERGTIKHPPLGEVKNRLSQRVEVYLINERDSYVVVAQLSPEFTARLVDYWQEHKNQQAQIPTTAEAFAQAFRMLADAEQRDALREQRLNLIDAKVVRIETAQTVLRARPANSESIVHIRNRVRRLFGLSDATIDAVMRQTPYAPKPAGMVRNEHAEAEGSTYAVFWTKDVTATFERFAAECKPVSKQYFEHPYVGSRFKMARRE